MIEGMEKNQTIQTYFDRYFAGSQLPPCDLTKAKQVVSARARSGKVRKIVAAAVSSAATFFACFVIAVVFAVRGIMGWWDNLLPGTNEPQGYLLADTTSTTVSYSDLSKKYDIAKKFAPFSLAENADAQYTLYLDGDKEVLLRADLRLVDATMFFRATVWCDLTKGENRVEGKYRLEDEDENFDDYRALVRDGSSYGFKTEYLNGEYVSRACMQKGDTEYIVYVMSSNDRALEFLRSML